MNESNKLGISFGQLVGGDAIIGDTKPTDLIEVRKRRLVKKKESTELATQDKKVNPSYIVENTNYSDSYTTTTALLYQTVGQIDELSSELKMEMDKLRHSNTIKGRYMYISNIASSIGSLLSNKVGAIREINNSIKAVNEAEYRRYKDIKAGEANQDDAAAIMGMYNAYISTPRGTLMNGGIDMNSLPPSSYDMTANGLNGIMHIDTASPTMRDNGFNNYMNNLSPEQNYMLNESNPDIEEVIIYDQSTGKKYFEWRNLVSGLPVDNMPLTSQSMIEDFVIDPKTRTAKNININATKKVIYTNNGVVSEF